MCTMGLMTKHFIKLLTAINFYCTWTSSMVSVVYIWTLKFEWIYILTCIDYYRFSHISLHNKDICGKYDGNSPVTWGPFFVFGRNC